MNPSARRLSLILLFANASASVGQTQSEASASGAASPSSIEFSSVAQAMEAVTARPGVSVTTTKPDAWIIVNEQGGSSVWSFTPATHYAYPAVVHRALAIDAKGNVRVEMSSLCEARKESCNRLVEEFKEMNAKMREQVQMLLKRPSGG